MLALALLAEAIAMFALGCLAGMWLARPVRIPEHPSLRRRTTQRPMLRVIDGDYQPYDQDKELRAE